MRVRRDLWKSIPLFECCEFQRGVVFSTKDEVDCGGYSILRSHNVDFLLSKVSMHNLKYISKNVKVKSSQRLMKNDILISVANSKEQTGKVGFSFEDTDSYAGGFMAIIRPTKAIEPYFLFNSLITDNSKEFIAGRTQGTTNIFNITFDRIKDLSIHLPSSEEQKQIASLFQSIETTIEQVEGQEKNLKDLQKKLVNGLFDDQPVFGNIIKKENLRFTSFGKITDCIELHDKLKKGVTRFIGLEDIKPENLEIATWGDIEQGTTFTKRFSKGDVLFGKRRAYLKKVAVPDFDGICSGDILVFRAKKEEILPELLPFYIASEVFIQHAVKTSAGSLSPRTKWKDLKELELSIPELKTQETILKVFLQLQNSNQLLKEQKVTLKNLKQKLLNEILG